MKAHMGLTWDLEKAKLVSSIAIPWHISQKYSISIQVHITLFFP
jgi:hypothetical protein